MRTTIRLADDHRDTLIALAAARGDKGISKVVEDAVSFYLAERDKPAVIPAPVVAPPARVEASPGRWQRIGARVDRSFGDPRALFALAVRALRSRFGRPTA
jgi:hypothetical protein